MGDNDDKPGQYEGKAYEQALYVVLNWNVTVFNSQFI